MLRRDPGTSDDPFTIRNPIDDIYDIDPLSLIYPTNHNSNAIPNINRNAKPLPPTPPLVQATTKGAPKPTIRLLFSLLPKRHCIFLLPPAILSSLVAGGIAPFMTFVVGQAFDAFSRFASSAPAPGSSLPPQQVIDSFLHDIGLAALQLIGLAVGSVALGSVTSCLWIWVGEVNVMAVRKRIYWGVTRREMGWFDTHLGEAEGDEEGKEGSVGAGGLLAQFTRDTDHVRTASSLSTGLLLQHLTTAVAALLLALTRSYQLTLLILASVPFLVFIEGVAQATSAPLLANERDATARTAGLVERTVRAVSTLKAFNAERTELARAYTLFTSLRLAARRLNSLWAFTNAGAQAVLMMMFVQGFWFGGKLVRDNKASAGDVMAVFWACLIAAGGLQMCVPLLIEVGKGKEGMVGLLGLVEEVEKEDPKPRGSIDKTSSARSKSISHPSPLGKSSLRSKTGGPLLPLASSTTPPTISLHNVTLAYPTRPSPPSAPALSHVSMHLTGGRTTYIVGSSGSGKSTIAALLMGWYPPQRGEIKLGSREVDISSDEWKTWVEQEVFCVGQGGAGGAVILEGRSLSENVAAAAAFRVDEHGGRRPLVNRKQVEEACQAALLHEFVRDLPAGYDTTLSSGAGGGGGEDEDEDDVGESGGDGGIVLSGGQRQRLALARAWVRDPSVLILDEATSALDPPSRLLIAEALRQSRQGKTTLVITHDLAQIENGDFVYVMKEGRVVERGYRRDLEKQRRDGKGKGEFRRMVEIVEGLGMNGWVPEELVEVVKPMQVEKKRSDLLEGDDAPSVKHQSIPSRPPTWANWRSLGPNRSLASFVPVPVRMPISGSNTPLGLSMKHLSLNQPRLAKDAGDRYTRLPERQRRPSTVHFTTSSLAGSMPLPPDPALMVTSRRFSLPSPMASPLLKEPEFQFTLVQDDEGFKSEKEVVKRSGTSAQGGRERRKRVERVFRGTEGTLDSIVISDSVHPPSMGLKPQERSPTSLFGLLRFIIPTIPHKLLLLLGLATCITSGLITPLFSFLLSRVLFEVSAGARNTHALNFFGGILLALAALDGIFIGAKYWLMETCAMYWVTHLRRQALTRVFMQDRAWFDSPANPPSRLVQLLLKDADDARDLVSVVLAQLVVVVTMLGVGLTWAMIRGWQLTLAGLAVLPVFVVVMVLQARWVGKCERRGRRDRERVARGFYDVITNTRSIRCMSLQPFFDLQFEAAAEKALITGVQGAFVEGCTYGLASGLIYLAEAVLFYVGAVLIANGTYSYLRMIEVLNLVVFSVTIASQLMAFTEKIAKSVQATADFNQLTTLPLDTSESQGTLRPPLSPPLSLPITFHDVSFAYPESQGIPVLKELSFTIHPGECIAVVGSSGCGKSTLALLLQRLYEPTQGHITFGTHPLSTLDVHHLREHVAVVSQHPHLLDASVADNIRYAQLHLSDEDVRRAAERAGVDEFVSGLPRGYDTPLGENASLISGGQAQRLQIARAFACRPHASLLILDECTSALDGENERRIVEGVLGMVREAGVSVLMITHKVRLMRACGRVVVLEGGGVVEEGGFEELLGRRDGVFSRLAGAGEWVW